MSNSDPAGHQPPDPPSSRSDASRVPADLETAALAELANEVIFDIGHSILDSISKASSQWRTCYVRAERNADDMGLNYFYFEDIAENDKKPFNIQNKFEFYDQLMTLADYTRNEAGIRWKACLCRIHKSEGKVDVSFDYENATRWRENHLD